MALVDEMYVLPGLRGQGIGSAVMDAVLSVASSRGIALVEINVDEADVDAQRFYVQHGFDSAEPTTGERAYYFSREMPG